LAKTSVVFKDLYGSRTRTRTFLEDNNTYRVTVKNGLLADTSNSKTFFTVSSCTVAVIRIRIRM